MGVKQFTQSIFNRFGYTVMSSTKAEQKIFLSDRYQRLNYRRLEHLASLGLDIEGSTVLEAGAGIGDLTSFFIDRKCQIVTSDARDENIEKLRLRYPELEILNLDLDNPPEMFSRSFDIVYCYGVLYHLKHPDIAIEFMAKCCKKMLLISTCVSYVEENELHLCDEDIFEPTQSVSGAGCRPSRSWVVNELKKHFEFVYLPTTQPNHEQFPIDWNLNTLPNQQGLTRSVFVASRQAIQNTNLRKEILDKQLRH